MMSDILVGSGLVLTTGEVPQVWTSLSELGFPYKYAPYPAAMCPAPMTDIMTCSMREVVVTQLPESAVPRPSSTDIDDIRKAKCIDAAFNEGFAMETPPAPAMKAPKRSGNRAVT